MNNLVHNNFICVQIALQNTFPEVKVLGQSEWISKFVTIAKLLSMGSAPIAIYERPALTETHQSMALDAFGFLTI